MLSWYIFSTIFFQSKKVLQEWKFGFGLGSCRSVRYMALIAATEIQSNSRFSQNVAKILAKWLWINSVNKVTGSSRSKHSEAFWKIALKKVNFRKFTSRRRRNRKQALLNFLFLNTFLQNYFQKDPFVSALKNRYS